MKRSIFILLLFFIVLVLVYSPVLYFNYLFHDDGSFWLRVPASGFRHYAHDLAIAHGRLGQAWLLDLENFFVHTIADLKIFRFVSICLSSLTAFLLWRQMQRLSFSAFQSFFIASAMFFLPGFSENIFLADAAPLTIPLLLSVLSFNYRSILFLVIALTIYPAAAMFYWTLTGMYILFCANQDSTDFRKTLSQLLMIGIISTAIYGLLIFVTHFFFQDQINSSLYNPYAINSDWVRKLGWFIQEPLNNALNLWNIFPKAIISLLIAGSIGATGVTALFKNKFSMASLSRSALLIIIVFLSFLPNLAAQGDAAFYRCLIPLTSLIWLFFVWALRQWRLTHLLALIAIGAGLITFNNVLTYRVRPSFEECSAYERMAQTIQTHKTDAIHIILPFHAPSIERYDEYGVLSSHYSFDLYPLIEAALQSSGGEPSALPLVYISAPDSPAIYRLEQIYFKKLPGNQWAFTVLHRENEFHLYDHSGKHTLDTGMTILLAPQAGIDPHLSLYTLNINDVVRPKADH